MDYSTPRQGERFRLSDGRQFIFTAIEPANSIRGWWWKAMSISGESKMEGNYKFKRCGLSEGWTPL